MNVLTGQRPLSLVIIGLSFGRHILDTFASQPAAKLFKLVGVCDLQPRLADEVAAEFGVRPYYSLDDVLQDSSVQTIGLYTQPFGRAKLIREIIRAGKDVMTTKPFELDADEAESVLREAESLGRVVHLNSPSPEPTEELSCIQTWEDEFDLGCLVSARGEVWASYFEDVDGSWMDDHALCPGGAMMRLGIYLINDIVHLAGPVQQSSLISSRIRTGRPTPDNALLSMSFASGCLASVYASFSVDDGDRYSNGLTLNYERGSIYRNVGVPGSLPKSKNSHLSLIMREGDRHRIVAEKKFSEVSGVYQWGNFYRSILAGESIDGTYIQKIVEGVRILESMRGLVGVI